VLDLHVPTPYQWKVHPPRWLLPLVAVVALLGNAATTWAGAGMVGDTQCCCPDPERCKCHDHDGEAAPTSELKRCSGDVQIVAPIHLIAIAPSLVSIAAAPVATAVDVDPPPIADHVPEPPEKPPF
jgi:hypothetical protein